jgi:hypothetical protein
MSGHPVVKLRCGQQHFDRREVPSQTPPELFRRSANGETDRTSGESDPVDRAESLGPSDMAVVRMVLSGREARVHN